MRLHKQFWITTLAACALFVGVTRAQTVPPVINYEGKLLDQNGNPVNGNLTMIFSIFDAATGDTALYSETQTITVNEGVFHALIGSVTPIPQTLFDRVPPAGFLEITVNGTTLSRRRRFGSAAYAFHSGSVNITSVNAGVGLAANATTGEVTLRLVDDGVTSSKILNGTIRAADLAANSVHSEEIGAGAVGTAEIVANAVGSSEIAAGAVGSSEIVDNAVTSSKIAEGAVDSRALANFIDLGDAGAADGRLQVFSSAKSDAAVKVDGFSSGAGLIRTHNDQSREVIYLGIDDFFNPKAGELRVYGPNGGLNAVLGSDYQKPNYGSFGINDAQGFAGGGIYVDDFPEPGSGVVSGDVKNFRMSHPYAADQEIWYASIEGPEAAAYIRGTARLSNGRASIVFPEHFQIVANAESMTVRLTPLDAGSQGLAVTGKSTTAIEVRELRQGSGSYDFDWEVKSVRKGHEGFRVLRSNAESRPARAGEAAR